ncbi:MAG TPA: hypothetical protein DEB39_09390 [Planctomycetaceae bacterium]|nr:hypothetical protein [Planctomycetaceae bacterium]
MNAFFHRENGKRSMRLSKNTVKKHRHKRGVFHGNRFFQTTGLQTTGRFNERSDIPARQFFTLSCLSLACLSLVRQTIREIHPHHIPINR